ncbi:Leucine-rich_repeat domain superfamily [Hexamita inflata]|uniref:Leucine-rich repeat domain superfamily n=1 Tax=Hexamita inflata TaxID=28002 RepID=A0AA86TT04_9EUKA|nr:Leucine-rich repeat domain superfamily [Hexamita inflata]
MKVVVDAYEPAKGVDQLNIIFNILDRSVCLDFQNTLRVPTNPRTFYHYSSALKTAKGVERLVGLEGLSLEGNQIVELNIRGLDKLEYLLASNNKIRDLSGAEYLKAKGCCQTRCAIEGQTQPSQEEIDEARLW